MAILLGKKYQGKTVEALRKIDPLILSVGDMDQRGMNALVYGNMEGTVYGDVAVISVLSGEEEDAWYQRAYRETFSTVKINKALLFELTSPGVMNLCEDNNNVFISFEDARRAILEMFDHTMPDNYSNNNALARAITEVLFYYDRKDGVDWVISRRVVMDASLRMFLTIREDTHNNIYSFVDKKFSEIESLKPHDEISVMAGLDWLHHRKYKTGVEVSLYKFVCEKLKLLGVSLADELPKSCFELIARKAGVLK